MSSAMSSAVADDTSRRHPHSVSNLAFHNETNKSCSLNADCRRMNHVSSKCYRARTDPIEAIRWTTETGFNVTAPRMARKWSDRRSLARGEWYASM